MMIPRIPAALFLVALLFTEVLCNQSLFAATWPQESATVDFARDIRPLLSDTCYHCHGPDQENQQADLRLDLKESLYQVHDGMALVVPGKVDQSLLFQRITAKDPADRMPPEEAQVKLSETQIHM